MKSKTLSIFKKVGFWLLILIGLNLITTTAIGGFSNPSLTFIQIFLSIPKHFLWNFSTGVNIKFGKWQIVDSLDEFGDKIPGEKIIQANFKGKMSNAVLSGTEMIAQVNILDSAMAILFFEYGNQKAELPKSEFIDIQVKLSNGEIVNIRQFLYEGMMMDIDGGLRKLLLSEKEPIKVLADLSDVSEYETTVYNFEISTKGLKDIIK